MSDGSNAASNALDRWPEGRPVGLMALSKKPPQDTDAALSQPGVLRWWATRAENMISGPDVVPPFEWMHMIELRDATEAEAVAQRWIGDGEPSDYSLLVGAPIPPMAQRIMRAMHLALRWLPNPRDPGQAFATSTSQLPGVNPSPAQVQRCDELAQDHPVVALNLNLHKETGTHPDTGAQESGHAIANNYFRRGVPTFHRLGARALWAGSCRGCLADGLAVGEFDQMALILYPSRDHFARLLRIGGHEGWDRYRAAGLERSWVVHCRVSGSSEARDR